ncbi:MAG: hypothetical protein H7247_18120, partial [Polaromonas sp.]|nr:hypothetical protein [Gemmatimonadaceae bacterium]
MDTPEDMLELQYPELRMQAEEAADTSGVDRREFLFMSMIAAAASTFGAHVVRAQGAGSSAAAAAAAPASAQQPQIPALLLGNGEPPAEQFMPYPGGTGALMEKLVREHGPRAFERSHFSVEKWSGALPGTDEAIAFLPAHRLSALIKARKITSVRLTTIYLERLRRLNPILLCAVTIMES